VTAVDPARLVRGALWHGAIAGAAPNSLFVVAAGKGACPMASALHECEGPRVAAGVVAGPRVGDRPIPAPFEWFDAAHPLPDATSGRAAERALTLAARSRDRGTFVLLLSGGASSMLALPAEGLTLDDKARAAHALMHLGVPIEQLNTVRKHLSAIKGGRLARAAGHSVTLAISDVHGEAADPSAIGSGPTLGDPSTYAGALAIAARAAERMPEAVIAHLEAGTRGEREETVKPGDPCLERATFEVIGTRDIAMAAAERAARHEGYVTHRIEAATSGEAREAAALFATEALKASMGSTAPFCVIASGETTVRVRGQGRGGRNQEFVLSLVPLLERLAEARTVAVAIASAGTDGIDGPTNAAGAIADTSTPMRAARAGLSVDDALDRNGAYDFFLPLDDLIVWGPTGTNVGDIHVMLVA
jgi:glycerate 2-kinase